MRQAYFLTLLSFLIVITTSSHSGFDPSNWRAQRGYWIDVYRDRAHHIQAQRSRAADAYITHYLSTTNTRKRRRKEREVPNYVFGRPLAFYENPGNYFSHRY